MPAGHAFEKVFFTAGVVFVLAAIFRWKMSRSEQVPSGLTGIALVLMELKAVVPLSGTAEDIALIGSAIALWAGVIIRLRRHKPGGAAA